MKDVRVISLTFFCFRVCAYEGEIASISLCNCINPFISAN